MRTVCVLSLLALAYTFSLLAIASKIARIEESRWDLSQFLASSRRYQVHHLEIHPSPPSDTDEATSSIVQKRAVPSFPKYNTPEFERQCPWAVPKTTTVKRNCTFFVRPNVHDREGVSMWVALITQAHHFARQADCNLIFDYGTDINVSSIIIPTAWNWTVPEGFKTCRQFNNCYHWGSPSFGQQVSYETISKQQNKSVEDVPLIRYAYRLGQERLRLYKDSFEGIRRNLPSFEPEIAMACSLESLFHLSPKCSQYIPDLFTRIMPALHAEDSVAISLYIRTRQADTSVDKEKKNDANPFVEENDYRDLAKNIIDCAIKQEATYLRNGTFSKAVWMVVTDSKQLKTWIAETYSTDTRQVLFTDSRGAHTRSDHGPSRADFAEAMIDWYLIGESDFVILDKTSVSYGGTASLRTARPVYDATDGICTKAIAIHDRG